MIGDVLNPASFARFDKINPALIKQVLAVGDKAIPQDFAFGVIGEGHAGKHGKVVLDVVTPFPFIGVDTALHGLHQGTESMRVQGLAVNRIGKAVSEFANNALVESEEKDRKAGVANYVGTFNDGGGFATTCYCIDRAGAIDRVFHPIKDCGLIL